MSCDYTAYEALSLMDDDKAIIIDVRTKGEQDEFHLDKTVLMPTDLSQEPISELARRVRSIDAGGKEMILMCHSGNRSKYMQVELAALGVKVGNLLGGIISAKAAK